MKNIGRIMVISGIIVSLGMLINVLNVNAMRGGGLTGVPRKTEGSYSQTREAERMRQRVNGYLEGYDFRTGQAIKLFPDEKWQFITLNFFIKIKCSILNNSDAPKYICLYNKVMAYKFIDDNIDYFSNKAGESLLWNLVNKGIGLSNDQLIELINHIKFRLHEPGVLADKTWSDEMIWSYLDNHYGYAMDLLRL